MTFAPYRGLRVVDLSDELLAMAGSVLCGLGADVILVEPPGGGAAREVPPVAALPGAVPAGNPGAVPASGPGGGPAGGMVSAHFLSTAAGKRSVTAALDRPEGAGLVRGLIERSDVLLCSADDASLRQCGLDLAELMAANPRLIVASLTPFGRTGPLSHWRGSDLVAWASSGALTPIGDPDRRPLAPGGSIAAAAGSLNVVAGTLLAVAARAVTGRGQLVDVSLQEAVLGITGESGPTFALEDLTGVGARRVGRRRGAASGMFPTTDGWVELLPFMPGQWDALAEWIREDLGIEEATMDVFRGSVGVRVPYAELLDGWVEQLTSRYAKQDFLLEAQRRAIPCGAVNEPVDLLDDPQLAAVNAWSEADVPGAGTLKWPRLPLRFDHQVLDTGAVPAVGEANDEVWGGLLGVGADERGRLAVAGCI